MAGPIGMGVGHGAWGMGRGAWGTSRGRGLVPLPLPFCTRHCTAGNRMYVEVPIKTTIECLVFTPIMAALGMSINEYMKPAGTCHSVAVRLQNEFWKVQADMCPNIP